MTQKSPHSPTAKGKKTSTAIHLNPGKEVSYEANLTFDNAVLGDNKEEVKR
jgi:hypothetical protein